MKLLILQEKLKKALKIIERISPRSLTLPILNNVSIQTEKNFLKLSTTDLDLGVNYWLLSKIEKQGQVVIPVSIVSNFLSFLPNKQVLLQKKENNLIIECDKYKTEIKGFLPNDFPIIPNVPNENFVKIKSSLFCKGLEQVVDITSPSQSRPEISGVYLSLKGKELKLVATDSFRLGEKTIFFEGVNNNQEFSMILPQKTVKEIINIFGEQEDNIKIYFSPNQIMVENKIKEVKHPEVQLISKLIEGDYPNYQEIIPKKYTTQVLLNKNDFLNHLKTASFFVNKLNEIKIEINPKRNNLTISSQNPEVGNYSSILNVKIKGAPLKISFNYKFLIHGVSIIKTKDILFELNKEEGPAILKPVGDNSFIYVVMPIKAS